jgi:hypothetical protein
MIGPLIQFFERLITEFTWRRLLFVITFLFVSICSLAFYEVYTGHFRYARIEHASKLLDRLTAQEKPVRDSGSEDLREIHRSLVTDLRQQLDPQRRATVPLWIWKLLAASVPWVFVTLLTYFSSSGSYASTFGGILLLALPVIILGCLLPTFSSPWVNYILYPVASTVVVVVVVVLYSKRKGATKA